MHMLNFEVLIWLGCIVCSLFEAILTIFYDQIRNRVQSNYYHGLFFGNMLLLSGFLLVLPVFSLNVPVLIFEMIEIVFIQACLIIYVRVIWKKSINLALFFFSIVLFGLFRVVGDYFFYTSAISVPFVDLNQMFAAIIYEFLYILILSLGFIFLLYFYTKFFSNISLYRTIFSLLWACIFFFGMSPFIDLLIQESGHTAYFLIALWPGIGTLTSLMTVGMVIQFSFFIGLMVIVAVKYGRKFRNSLFFYNQSGPIPLKKKIGIGIIIFILIGTGFLFLYFVQFALPIIHQITFMLEYSPSFLTHPFWIVGGIYLISLLIPFFASYVIITLVKNRKNLWANPNYFNQAPFFNLAFVVFSFFIISYYELVPEVAVFRLNPLFVLTIAYIALITFLCLFATYFFSHKRGQWFEQTYSLKIVVYFIPFFIGYLLAGKTLGATEILFGIMLCGTLQIYVLYLRSAYIENPTMRSRHLNFFLPLLWGLLSILLAGLFSLVSLIAIVLNLVLFFGIFYKIEQRKLRGLFYGLTFGNMVLIGGTSDTLLSNQNAIGFPNIFVFIGYLLLVVLGAIFFYIDIPRKTRWGTIAQHHKKQRVRYQEL